MQTEIWRDFDPNLDIPLGLKNARYVAKPDVTDTNPEPDADIDIQTETLSDEDSDLNEDVEDGVLEVPGSFDIVSQTVRTGPDGSQVVDIVIDVEDVDGALNYEIRMTK